MATMRRFIEIRPRASGACCPPPERRPRELPPPAARSITRRIGAATENGGTRLRRVRSLGLLLGLPRMAALPLLLVRLRRFLRLALMLGALLRRRLRRLRRPHPAMLSRLPDRKSVG